MFTTNTNFRNYSNGILKKSKKIQKLDSESKPNNNKPFGGNQTNKKIKSNGIVLNLENLDSFLNEETNQFQKIKERTSKMIRFDKHLMKKAILSLQNYSQKNMSMDENCKTDIILELVLNKKPQKIPWKCLNM